MKRLLALLLAAILTLSCCSVVLPVSAVTYPLNRGKRALQYAGLDIPLIRMALKEPVKPSKLNKLQEVSKRFGSQTSS